MKKLIFVFAAFVLISAFYSSCNSPTIFGDTNIIFPDSLVSYQKHVEPFFKVSCALQGCHSENMPAGGRIMTSYSHIMFDIENLGFVIPFQPENSFLMHKLEGRNPFSFRCYQGKLKENNVKGIRKWIAEGALNN